MKRTITIDGRMINASGIGTYIINVLPIIINSLSNNVSFNILGDLDELGQIGFLKKKNINLIDFTCPIYSIHEQLNYIRAIPDETELFWAPHYNFPIFYNKKLLVSIHDLGHLALKEINHEVTKRLYASFMFKQIKNKADAMVYVSEFSRQEFNKFIGRPKCPQEVTLLGVNSSWFNIPRSEPVSSKPYLLYVGNVKPHKNLGRLIAAFGRIKNTIPHNLIIVGKKEGFITSDETLFDKVKKYDDRIIFTGRISDEKLRKYVAQADTFVFPSFYEGFGLPPIEAMAAGIPVISSNAASIPEVCGDAALYFDPHKIEDISGKILRMVCNESLKRDYIKRGKKRVKLFSWEKTAEKTINVIKNILEFNS